MKKYNIRVVICCHYSKFDSFLLRMLGGALNRICTWLDIIFSLFYVCLFLGRQPPHWARASSFSRLLDHTQRRDTVGRTRLDEWSARRTDIYLTSHNTHNRQPSLPTVGFEHHNLSRRAAADLCLRPRGHWDRLSILRRKEKQLQKCVIGGQKFLKIDTGCWIYNCR